MRFISCGVLARMLRQYSLRTMLGLVAILCLSLAFTQVNYLMGGAAIVAYVVGVALFARDPFRKRALVYGSVGGACLFVAVGLVVATVRGELPVTSYTTPDTAISLTRQYAIPLGGFFGALAGCIYADGRRTREDEGAVRS